MNTINSTINNKKKWLLVYIIIITFIQLIIVTGLPLYINAINVQDDFLMVKLADSIAKGEWLGAYDNNTLVKAPMFPIFLAILTSLNIPYLWGIAILNIVSAIVFCLAVRPKIKSSVSICIIYTVLIFSPSNFSFLPTQTMYRNAIIPGFVLLVISTLSAIFIRRRRSNIEILPWTIGAGISSSVFWYTREDSIWLLPFIVTAIFITIICTIYTYKNNKKHRNRKIFICTVPLLMIVLVGNLISLMNYKYYNVYTTHELGETYFEKMMSEIYMIEQDEEKPYVWVNRSTIDKILEVSPTFNTIREPMEELFIDSFWERYGFLGEDGEIEGGYMAWAIRDAVQSQGYYSNGGTANGFYKNVYNEIKDAFKNNKLIKKNQLQIPLLGAWKEYYKELLPKKLAESMNWVIGFEKYRAESLASVPPLENIRLAEAITNNRFIYPSRDRFVIKDGWIFAKDDNDSMQIKLTDKDGNVLQNIEFEESMGVYRHFEEQDRLYENAKKSRIYVDLDTDEKEIYLNINIEGKETQLEISNQQYIYEEQEDFIAYFVVDQVVQHDVVADNTGVNIEISNKIINVYKKSSKLFLGLGIIIYCMMSILCISDVKNKKYRLLDSWIISTGIIASLLVLVFGVTYAYIEAHNSDGRYLYMTATSILLVAFYSFLIGTFYEFARDFFKK